MKIAEKIIGAIAIIAVILNLFRVVGSDSLIVLSLSALAVFYMYGSFALFNGIRFRKVFKKVSYRGISRMRIMGAILTGLALALTIMGIFFKIMYFPGGATNMMIGISGLLLVLIIALIKFQATKSDYYSRILKRTAIFGGIALILTILPNDTYVKIKYRNHPAYVEAFKNALEDRENQELWNKVDEERKKIEKGQ